MSNCYFRIIDAEKRETAREKALEKICRKRRNADAARLIAEKMDGRYITKRVEPELVSLFPDAARVYLHQSYGSVSLVICRGPGSSDRYWIPLCRTDSRRIDRAGMIHHAESLEQDADALEADLQNLDTLVEIYNVTAARYAEIHTGLNSFFDDIPYADYLLDGDRRDRGNAGGLSMTPEEFAVCAAG